MLKNRRVLITGATGFIGANLVRKCLDAGAKVSILTRSASEKWRIEDILGEVQECVADLLDYDRLKKVVSKIKPEIVFHTATYGGYFFQK
ncbi:MAG: SDR family NAD(P)-dependent oxidoreductase, partial [Candidatus Omnitrophota bacterium]